MLPLIIGSALISAGSSFLKHQAQKKAAKENKKQVLASLRLTYQDLDARAAQEQAAATQARMATQVQGEGLRGEMTTSAASSNVAGGSVLAALNDITRQEGEATSTIDTNLTNTLDQVQRSKRGARAQAEGQIASVQPPSWWGTGLEIGGTALDAYGKYKGY